MLAQAMPAFGATTLVPNDGRRCAAVAAAQPSNTEGAAEYQVCGARQRDVLDAVVFDDAHT